MRSWKSILLVIFLGLLALVIVLEISLFLKGGVSKIIFLNLKPGFSLNIDKTKLTDYEHELQEVSGKNKLVLVIVKRDFKATSSGAGWGENAPAIYGEWSAVKSINILSIYISDAEWQKIPQETRNKLFRRFIANEINSFWAAGMKVSTESRF